MAAGSLLCGTAHTNPDGLADRSFAVEGSDLYTAPWLSLNPKSSFPDPRSRHVGRTLAAGADRGEPLTTVHPNCVVRPRSWLMGQGHPQAGAGVLTPWRALARPPCSGCSS